MNNKVIDAIKSVASEQNINISITKENMNVPLKELGIDSITAMALIVAIEQKLGVRVPDSELKKITTIDLLIKQFEELLK